MVARLRPRCSFLVAVGLVSGTSLAAPKFQGVGRASLGATDNIQSAPSNAAAAERSAGAFVLLSPGVVLAVTAPRYVQRANYAYTYDFVLANAKASTSSNQLAYLGFFDLSPRLGLVVAGTAIQSNRYAALVLTQPGAGALNALPPGSGSFLSATAGELLSYDISVGWRGYEGVTVTEQTPLFGTVAPRTFAPGARVGVERSWDRDAVGLETRGDYAVISGSTRPDGTPLGQQRQLIGTGLASWRHDLSPAFSTRAEGGILRVQRLNLGRGFWEPTALAAVAYATEGGDADLQVAHTVAVNPLLGQTLLIDEVRLRGDLPLTKKGEVSISGSTGYQRGQIVEDDARVAARVDTLLFDLGLGFQVVPTLLLDLRYQHVEQRSDVNAPPLPLGFVRNTVLFSAVVRFPPESEMPRAYRAPRRVDRQDEIRDAATPSTAPGAEGGRAGGSSR